MEEQMALEPSMGMMLGLGCFVVGFITLMIASMWMTYSKAGKPGWASLIPIYNLMVMLQIVGRPTWWIALMFLPVVNMIAGIVLSLDLAKSFGKGTGFGLGLVCFGWLFLPMLAFGKAQYVGPVAGGATGTTNGNGNYPNIQSPVGGNSDHFKKTGT